MIDFKMNFIDEHKSFQDEIGELEGPRNDECSEIIFHGARKKTKRFFLYYASIAS
jgi:hypothetical protein